MRFLIRSPRRILLLPLHQKIPIASKLLIAVSHLVKENILIAYSVLFFTGISPKICNAPLTTSVERRKLDNNEASYNASYALVTDSLGIFEGRENRWLKSV